MSRSTTRTIMAGTAALALGLTMASGAQAAGAVIDRVAGADRYETAVELSMLGFKEEGSAAAVILARSDSYADAMAGSPLAVDKNGPLLLTAPNALNADTAAEIERVLAEDGTIYVLGGEVAVSPGVVDALVDLGYSVERIAGDTRYTTALAVAEEIGTYESILLATGYDFPDALSAGNAAAAADGVVVLTEADEITPEVLEFLEAATEELVAVGWPAVIAATNAELTVSEELTGADRFATSIAVAEHFFSFETPGVSGIALASGEDFPDALTAGPASGRSGHPVVLTAKDSLPAVTEAYARSVGASPATVLGFVVGGEQAISQAVYDAFDAALRNAEPTS